MNGPTLTPTPTHADALGDRARRYPRPPWSMANPGALFESLRAVPGVIDVIVTEEHVAVVRDSVFLPTPQGESFEAAVAAALSRETSSAADESRPRTAPRVHVVSVRYDGADLEECGARLGLTRKGLMAIHASGTYEVKMIGFLPGFAYLGDLDARLVLPRRESPRTRVAPASVAMADEYTAIYPFASPGGWHLLGTATDFEPFTFELGDCVRFEPR